MAEHQYVNWKHAKEFLGVKRVEAMIMCLGTYNAYRGWTIPEDENPNDIGYIVKYPDGYISWCPLEQFEAANREISEMTFGAAIEAMAAGCKVARAGWNGKGMWVTLTPGKTLDMGYDDIWTGNVRDLAVANGGTVEILPYMSMKTADNKLQIGWLASQSDMVAEDWCIVE